MKTPHAYQTFAGAHRARNFMSARVLNREMGLHIESLQRGANASTDLSVY